MDHHHWVQILQFIATKHDLCGLAPVSRSIAQAAASSELWTSALQHEAKSAVQRLGSTSNAAESRSDLAGAAVWWERFSHPALVHAAAGIVFASAVGSSRTPSPAAAAGGSPGPRAQRRRASVSSATPPVDQYTCVAQAVPGASSTARSRAQQLHDTLQWPPLDPPASPQPPLTKAHTSTSTTSTTQHPQHAPSGGGAGIAGRGAPHSPQPGMHFQGIGHSTMQALAPSLVHSAVLTAMLVPPSIALASPQAIKCAPFAGEATPPAPPSPAPPSGASWFSRVFGGGGSTGQVSQGTPAAHRKRLLQPTHAQCVFHRGDIPLHASRRQELAATGAHWAWLQQRMHPDWDASSVETTSVAGSEVEGASASFMPSPPPSPSPGNPPLNRSTAPQAFHDVHVSGEGHEQSGGGGSGAPPPSSPPRPPQLPMDMPGHRRALLVGPPSAGLVELLRSMAPDAIEVRNPFDPAAVNVAFPESALPPAGAGWAHAKPAESAGHSYRTASVSAPRASGQPRGSSDSRSRAHTGPVGSTGPATPTLEAPTRSTTHQAPHAPMEALPAQIALEKGVLLHFDVTGECSVCVLHMQHALHDVTLVAVSVQPPLRGTDAGAAWLHGFMRAFVQDVRLRASRTSTGDHDDMQVIPSPFHCIVVAPGSARTGEADEHQSETQCLQLQQVVACLGVPSSVPQAVLLPNCEDDTGIMSTFTPPQTALLAQGGQVICSHACRGNALAPLHSAPEATVFQMSAGGATVPSSLLSWVVSTAKAEEGGGAPALNLDILIQPMACIPTDHVPQWLQERWRLLGQMCGATAPDTPRLLPLLAVPAHAAGLHNVDADAPVFHSVHMPAFHIDAAELVLGAGQGAAFLQDLHEALAPRGGDLPSISLIPPAK